MIDFFGERGGDRTHDPVIKSHVLYRLSYALALKKGRHAAWTIWFMLSRCVGGGPLRVNSAAVPARGRL